MTSEGQGASKADAGGSNDNDHNNVDDHLGGVVEEEADKKEPSSRDRSESPFMVEAASSESASTTPTRSPATGAGGSGSNSNNNQSPVSSLVLPEAATLSSSSVLRQQKTTSPSCCGKSIATTTHNALSKASEQMLSKFDRWVQTWTKYVSSSLGQDRALKFLQWTLWLFSHLIKLRGQTLRALPSQYASCELHSQALRKLYLDVSFARYVTRFVGLFGTLDGIRTGSWTPTSYSHKSSKLMQWLGHALTWSMVGYYPTEHLAYLHWMVPKAYARGRSAERWSYLSCRFWLVYIVAELTQCLVQYKELQDKLEQMKNSSDIDVRKGDGDDNNDGKEMNYSTLQVALRNVKYQMTRDALFLLPCIHWSLPNWDTQPWLNESLVNTLMWLESVICLYQ